MSGSTSTARTRPILVAVFALLLAVAVTIAGGGSAGAAPPSVDLGAADRFAVLAGSTVTNTGPSTINGDVGVSPGSSITGFPPGTVNGSIHRADAVAAQGQDDLTTAYNDAAGRPGGASISGDLGGENLSPGVYKASSSIGLTETLTLNGHGDANAVFIFQIGSTLTTASASRVNVVNGARSCNVFWQIGSSATLGTNSDFRGNILALTTITVETGATVDGRTLARNGAVTLDTNTITRARCAAAPTTGGGTASPTPTTGGGTATPTTGGGTPATPTTGGTATPSPTTGGGTPQVPRTPEGGVPAGGGSTAQDGSPGLLVTGSLIAAAVAAVVLRRRVTRST